MDIRKILVTGFVLAAIGSAGVLDGAPGLSLGDNPAVPAVVKEEKKIDAGFNLVKKQTTDKDKLRHDIYKEKDVDNVMDGFWASFSDKYDMGGQIGEFWYSFGIDLGTKELGKTQIYNNSQHDTVVANSTSEWNHDALDFSFTAAKDFAQFGGFTGGIKLGLHNRSSNRKEVTKPLNGAPKITEESSNKTDTYPTVVLGLVKNIDAKSTIVVGQTVAYETKTTYGDTTTRTGGSKTTDKGGDSSNSFIPAETAISYIYKVDKALEVAGTVAETWGSEYNYVATNRHGNDTADYDVTLPAYRTYGVAASYLFQDFEFLGYAQYSKNGTKYYDNDKRTDDNDLDDNRTLGVTVKWTPTFEDIGTIGVTVQNDRTVENIWTQDDTTTEVFYTYMF